MFLIANKDIIYNEDYIETKIFGTAHNIDPSLVEKLSVELKFAKASMKKKMVRILTKRNENSQQKKD